MDLLILHRCPQDPVQLVVCIRVISTIEYSHIIIGHFHTKIRVIL